MSVPQKIYTDQDLVRARKKGRIVGWLQGGAVVFGAGFLLKLLGWIPAVLVLGAVGYVGYRLLAKSPKKPDADT